MYKLYKPYMPVFIALMGLSVVLTVITLFLDRVLFYAFAVMTLMVFCGVLLYLRRANLQIRQQLWDISRSLADTHSTHLEHAAMPVLTLLENNEIVWYNRAAHAQLFPETDMRGEPIQAVFSGFDFKALADAGTAGFPLAFGNREFTAYISQAEEGSKSASVLYLMDDTHLKRVAREYYETKPSVAVLAVDNYDELLQNSKESERAQIMGELELLIEQYVAYYEGFVEKTGRDRFIAILSQRGLDKMVANKFELLDKARSLNFENRIPATLSIGVGRDAPNLYEAESMARQALDMCLGRGGDQVAIKTQNGYEFYGGVSKGVEKRTKVKTRIVATALGELIESSENVIVMGHRFADLDAIGAAVGIYRAIRSMNKPAWISINREKNLVQPMLERLLASGYTDEDFLPPEEAMSKITSNTLLIVVDTHVPHVLESEDVYRACKNVVVIDHHRKLVNHINNAVIFYHEPYASSASEMVAELLQYFESKPQVSRVEAEAMLAGIMLDTKNFVLRTGVRTFEAAAYLRKLGADTVEVRKLFFSSMESYQQKTALVSTAHIYHSCAIAVSTLATADVRIVAPQAADELMTIEGVDASFVLYDYEGTVNVSARSLGTINVQVIMEKLGGGGHLTMAAAQFPGGNIGEIMQLLKHAIDDYFQA